MEVKALVILVLVIHLSSGKEDGGGQSPEDSSLTTSSIVELVHTNFVSRSLTVLRNYVDATLGTEALPIGVAVVSYLVVKTVGVLGLFSMIATLVVHINKASYKILEKVFTKVVGTLLSDAILGREAKSIDFQSSPTTTASSFLRPNLDGGRQPDWLKDDQKLADLMTIVEWGIGSEK